MKVCAYCREEIRTGPACRCRVCAEPHHRACFERLRGCAVFGCTSRGTTGSVDWRAAMLLPVFMVLAVAGGWVGGRIADENPRLWPAAVRIDPGKEDGCDTLCPWGEESLRQFRAQ